MGGRTKALLAAGAVVAIGVLVAVAVGRPAADEPAPQSDTGPYAVLAEAAAAGVPAYVLVHTGT